MNISFQLTHTESRTDVRTYTSYTEAAIQKKNKNPYLVKMNKEKILVATPITHNML